MKTSHTYRAFKKFIRKNYKKYLIKRKCAINGKKITSYWFNPRNPDWISFRVTSQSVKKEPLILKYSDPMIKLSEYKNVIENYINRLVTINGENKEIKITGYLNSILITNFDIYWELKDKINSTEAKLYPMYQYPNIFLK